MEDNIKTGPGLLAIMKTKLPSEHSVFSIKDLEKSIEDMCKIDIEEEKRKQEAAKTNINFFMHLPKKDVLEQFSKNEIWMLYILCRQAPTGTIMTGRKGVGVMKKASFYINDNLKLQDSFYCFAIEQLLEKADII